MTRRGFTLLELLVAIVLTGVVALLVYGTVAAALDVEARTTARRDALRRTNGMRTIVRDALRAARPTGVGEEPAFVLEPATTTAGRPADRLAFVTVGGGPPLTDDTDWLVQLAVGPDGLFLTAVPTGVTDPVPVVARLPGITGLGVRVPGPGGTWTDEWSGLTPLPPVIQLTFWTDAGPEPPILVVIPRGGVL